MSTSSIERGESICEHLMRMCVMGESSSRAPEMAIILCFIIKTE
jgi:hypothetical protein